MSGRSSAKVGSRLNGASKSAAQKSLVGLRALVTGTDSAVGRAVAILFGKHGASIAVHYLFSADKAKAVVADIRKRGSDAFACGADLSSGADLQRMFREAVPRLGGLDVVVATPSAGRMLPPVEGGVGEHRREIHDTALIGQYLCALAAVRAFRRRPTPEWPRPYGKIIFVGPTHDDARWAGQVDYASADATEMMVKSVAQDVEKHRIRVNCIVAARGSAAGPRERRGADSGDVARAALWLASEEGDSVTGKIWVVGGDRAAGPIRGIEQPPSGIVGRGAS